MKGKWPYYDVMNFLEYYLQRGTMEMFQRQQMQLNPDETEIGNSEQLEEENIIHDQKTAEGRVKVKRS